MDCGLIYKENLLNQLLSVRQVLILRFSSQFYIFICITVVLHLQEIDNLLCNINCCRESKRATARYTR